jgi:hypothetical protein
MGIMRFGGKQIQYSAKSKNDSKPVFLLNRLLKMLPLKFVCENVAYLRIHQWLLVFYLENSNR